MITPEDKLDLLEIRLYALMGSIDSKSGHWTEERYERWKDICKRGGDPVNPAYSAFYNATLDLKRHI